jgi:hypothetical protein
MVRLFNARWRRRFTPAALFPIFASMASRCRLAGLLAAHDACVLSRKGKSDVVIGGLSGEQLFSSAFAQRWRKSQSEASLRRQIIADTHAPGEYRSDTVRNVEAWYKACEVTPGNKLYLKPEGSRRDMVTPLLIGSSNRTLASEERSHFPTTGVPGIWGDFD